jgi:DMSO/TMAO reductase YedYZ molybdopterin-dependent catalytic subunit
MSDEPILSIEGAVERPVRLSFARLAGFDAAHQVADVSRLDPKRAGDAVSLAGILELVGVHPEAAWLTLHASRDDFHASIPLADVRPHGLLVYRLKGEPLPASSGGPIRFLIPDSAACHTTEIDECANVKFVDRIELSRERGHDNRPEEERAHAELHRRQAEQAKR